MITINLLPQEYRRRERTSPRVFGITLVCVGVVCSAMGYLGYQYFGVLRQEQEARLAADDNLRNLERSAKYDDALIAEAKEYEKRSATMQQISRSRVLWTLKLDQLIDIVNNDGDSERHMVWFRNLNVSAGNDKVGPKLSMKGSSQTDAFSRVANFIEDVQKHEFFREFATISPPSGRVVSDETKHPPQTVEFPFDLAMKPAKDWVRNSKKDNKNAASPGGTPPK
jgi:hypothetical protein